METPQRLRRAQLQLMLDHPYLASAVARYPLVLSTTGQGVDTMATDGYRIYANPDFCNGLQDKELKGVLAHELLHNLLGHLDRRQNREHERWNVAIDHATNLLLLAMGFKLPDPKCCNPSYRGQAAEEIYGLLPRSTKTQNWDVHLDPDKLPNSLRSPADENPTKLERLRMQEGLRRELIRELKNSEEGSRNQGWLSGLFEQELQQAATPRIPWQSVLMRFVSAIRRSDYRSFPFNKRHIWRGIGLPSIGIPGPDHLVVAVDTSASMNNELLSQILAEIDRIRAFSECRMTLIECDAAIHRVTEWEAWDDSSAALQQWCFQGRGGTCFRPVFSWIKKQQRSGALNADALIYLTDGYGQFPDDCTLPVLWGVPEDGLDKGAFPFGEVLTIQEV